MLSPFSTAFAIPRINRLTLLSSRAQPGSPERASRARALARKKVARVGVEEPQSPMRASQARALARKKVACAAVQARNLLFRFVVIAMPPKLPHRATSFGWSLWSVGQQNHPLRSVLGLRPNRMCTYKMLRLMPLESALTQKGNGVAGCH
jgi:hypothetical protein